MVSSLGSLASPISCHGRQGGGVQVVWGSLPLTAPLTWGSPAPPSQMGRRVLRPIFRHSSFLGL